MNRLFHLVVFLCWGSGLALAQEVAFPVVKSGVWHIFNGKTEIKLPETYSFVSLFDEGGTAYFYQGQYYGIINREGKELIPANHQSILALGNGCYRFLSGDSLYIRKISSGGIQDLRCEKAKKIQDHWIAYEQGEQFFLLNTRQFKSIQLKDSTQDYHVLYDGYLILELDTSTQVLYDRDAKERYKGKVKLEQKLMYSQIEAGDLRLICDAYGSWYFPSGATMISTSETRIRYKVNNIAYLLERDSKKEIISFPCDKIEDYENGNFRYFINNKMGVLSPDKKILIEAKYNNISMNNDFIYVYFNTLIGLYDLKFKELLPCKYTSIRMDKNFFYTSSVGDVYGLVSRMSGKEILPCTFDKISFENNLVKAWSGSSLVILDLSPQHVVKNRLVLDNTITLRSKSPKARKDYWIDQRLFPLGWFYDTLAQVDPKTKSWVGTSYKWGLKNENDSVLLRSTMKQPLFIPGAPVSLVPNGVAKYEYLDGDLNDTPIFKLVNFTTGKSYNDLKVLSIDTMDFLSRNFARLGHVDGVSIIKADGKVKPLSYIDYSDETYLRYCQAEGFELQQKKGSETTTFTTYFFNNSYNAPYVFKNNVRYEALKFLHASWNFFDENGDSLFREPFVFAQPFYKNTAIVKRKSGWGLVNKDSLVIPAQYAWIERISVYKDTVFLVKLGQKGELYLDTNLQIISSNSDEMVNQKGDLMLFVHKDKKYLCNSQSLKKISPDYSNVKLHEFNRYVTKEKKEFLIFNENGSGIGSSATRPEDFMSPDFFTAESKGKIGLMSIQEDTVIPFQYKEISRIDDYFLAKNNLHQALYDESGSKLAEVESGIILLDSLSDFWAIVEAGKITVFDNQGVRIAKLKSELQFDHFYNKTLLASKSNFIRMGLDGKEFSFKEKMVEIEAFGGGYIRFQTDLKSSYLFDSNWKKVGDSSGVKEIIWNGGAIFSFSGKSGMKIMDLEQDKSAEKMMVRGKFDQAYTKAVTSKSARYSYFIDRDFHPAFQRNFIGSKPFRAGFAPIMDEQGWTIINQNGTQKSYPGFEEITAVSDCIFKAKKKVLCGIVDSHGRFILEPIYEKITFIEGKYIQVIKDGNIGYFDLTGKKIY